MPNPRLAVALLVLTVAGAAAAPGAGQEAGGAISIEKGGHAFVTASGKIAAVISHDPALYLELDREYGVVVAKIKDAPDVYTLVPLDDQSALGVIPGGARHLATDAELAKTPGFSHKGERPDVIGGSAVTWREWAYTNHFFGDTTAKITLPSGERLAVYLQVTANSPKRREALEASAASLRIAGPEDVPIATSPGP
jgi:hypothetical protein